MQEVQNEAAANLRAEEKEENYSGNVSARPWPWDKPTTHTRLNLFRQALRIELSDRLQYFLLTWIYKSAALVKCVRLPY